MKLLLALLLTCVPVDPDLVELAERLVKVMGPGPARAEIRKWLDEYQPLPPVVAFPGAEGFGAAEITGGRGGRVIHVTNLDDAVPAPPGSLRDAVLQTGTRTIVFDVGGNIHMARGGWDEMLRAAEGNFTIAGQTAPGGITIEGGQLWLDGCDNVIIRLIRLRGMEELINLNCDIRRVCTLMNGNGIILDHVSMCGSGDESPSIHGCTDVIIQWCTIEASCLKGQGGACHGSGNHNFGLLDMVRVPDGTLSIHHCVFAHHRRRSPRVWFNKPRGTCDFRNTTVYNYGEMACQFFVSAGNPEPDTIFCNVVGNTFIKGPTTLEFETENRYLIHTSELSSPTPKMFLPNMLDDPDPRLLNEWYTSLDPDDGPEPSRWPESTIWRPNTTTWMEQPAETPPMTTQRARVASRLVAARAGAWPRDATTRRTITEIKTRTGEHGIEGPYQQFPEKEGPCSAKWDTDRDGMPDAWEKRHGGDLDPNGIVPRGASPNNRHAGYTFLEFYINQLADAKVGKGK